MGPPSNASARAGVDQGVATRPYRARELWTSHELVSSLNSSQAGGGAAGKRREYAMPPIKSASRPNLGVRKYARASNQVSSASLRTWG